MTLGSLGVQRPLYEIKAELFKALVHPARIRILELLSQGETPVSDLLADTGMESSHLSQQHGRHHAFIFRGRKNHGFGCIDIGQEKAHYEAHRCCSHRNPVDHPAPHGHNLKTVDKRYLVR